MTATKKGLAALDQTIAGDVTIARRRLTRRWLRICRPTSILVCTLLLASGCSRGSDTTDEQRATAARQVATAPSAAAPVAQPAPAASTSTSTAAETTASDSAAPTDAGARRAGLHLTRSGESIDLLCPLAQAIDRSGATATSTCACAAITAQPCPHVAIGNDRRRAIAFEPERRVEMPLGGETPAIIRFAAAGTGQAATELPVSIRVKDQSGKTVGEWVRRVPVGARWIEGSVRIPDGSAPPLTLEVDVGAAQVNAARQAKVAAESPAESPAAPPRFQLAMPRAIRAGAQSSARPTNVLVYLIDTLRADHTSAYGYSRPTTPQLEKLAREGILFENAYSTAARTRPATASLLTSLYPSFHGAAAGLGLSSQVTTLAERFRSAGWSTFAFVTNGNVYGEGFNFDQGFDRFLSFPGPDNKHARSGDVNKRVFEILDQLRDEPFVLYIHTVDPHAPYDPPEGYAGKFTDSAYKGPIEPDKTLSKYLHQMQITPADIEQLKALYDEDILYQDAMLGVLLDRLAELGIADRTVVVVTADHGEEFHEHGNWSHGSRLFEEQIHIPLIIKVPGVPGLAGVRVKDPVQLVDVMPTLLSWFDLPGVDACQGHDLAPLLDTDGVKSAGTLRPIYAEETRWTPGGDVLSLRVGPLKLIRNGFGFDEQKDFVLFDLSRDPAEQSTLAHTDRSTLDQLVKQMRSYQGSLQQRFKPEHGIEAPVDEKTRRNLEALGYVD